MSDSRTKMAPVCTAGRLSLPYLCVLMFVLALICQSFYTSALLIYDRRTLLYLRSSAETKFLYGNPKTLPPVLMGVPDYLLCILATPFRRKRHRVRGRRSGRLVRLKFSLSRIATTGTNLFWSPLDSAYTWLVPLAGSEGWVFQQRPRYRIQRRSRQQGVNSTNLQALRRGVYSAKDQNRPAPVRIGLRNCLSMGANLASVQDLNEYNQIQIIVTAAGHGAKQAWIGGTNVQEESIWLCSDGSRFDYTHWCSGQNNKDGGNQRCLQINYSGAKCWDDLGSNHNLPSVCAKKP